MQQEREKVLAILKESGQDGLIIDESLFEQVKPEMWAVVEKLLNSQPPGTKLKRPRSSPSGGKKPDEPKLLPRKGEKVNDGPDFTDAEKKLLQELPCSFLKDEQGQIWAIEHGKKGNQSNDFYLGQGSFNLVKFAFRQDGHLACYRVNRERSQALSELETLFAPHNQINKIIIDTKGDVSFTTTYVDIAMNMNTEEYPHLKSLNGQTFEKTPEGIIKKVTQTTRGKTKLEPLDKAMKNTVKSEDKAKFIQPFLGVDGERYVAQNSATKSVTDYAQYFLDCAQQLSDSSGHADFKLANSLFRRDGSMLRGSVIDLDLRNDIDQYGCVTSTCRGYQHHGIPQIDDKIERLKGERKSLDGIINAVRPDIQKHDVFSLGLAMLEIMSKAMTEPQKSKITRLLQDLHGEDLRSEEDVLGHIQSIIKGMKGSSSEAKILGLIKKMVKMPQNRISMEEVCAKIPQVFGLTNPPNIQQESWQKLEASFSDKGEIKSLIELIKASPQERKHYVDNLELPPVYTKQLSTLSSLLHKVESTILVQLLKERDIPADVKTSLDSEFQQRISVLWQQLPQDRMLSCSKQERTQILTNSHMPQAFKPVFSQLSNLLRIVNPQKLKALQPSQKIAHLQELTGNPDIMTTLLKCELDARQRILSNDHIPLQYQQDFASPQYFVSFADPATLVQLHNEEDIPADVKTSLDSEFQQRISVLWQQLPQEAMLLSSKQERIQILRQYDVPEPFDFLFDLRNWLDSVKPDILEILPLSVKLKHLQELTKNPDIMTTLLKCELDARQRILSGEDIPEQYKQDFVNLSNLLSLADPLTLAQFTPSQKLKHLMEIQDSRPFVTLLTSDAASRAQFLSDISIPDQYKEDFADPNFLVSVWEEVFPSKTLSIPHLSQDVKEAVQKRLSERQQDPDRNASPVSRNVNVLAKQLRTLSNDATLPHRGRSNCSGSPPPVPSRTKKPFPSSHGSPPPPTASR